MVKPITHCPLCNVSLKKEERKRSKIVPIKPRQCPLSLSFSIAFPHVEGHTCQLPRMIFFPFHSAALIILWDFTFSAVYICWKRLRLLICVLTIASDFHKRRITRESTTLIRLSQIDFPSFSMRFDASCLIIYGLQSAILFFSLKFTLEFYGRSSSFPWQSPRNGHTLSRNAPLPPAHYTMCSQNFRDGAPLAYLSCRPSISTIISALSRHSLDFTHSLALIVSQSITCLPFPPSILTWREN